MRRFSFLIPLYLWVLLGSAYAQQTSDKAYYATLKLDQLLYESPGGKILTVLKKGDYVRLMPVLKAEDWYGIYTVDKEDGNKATFRGYLKFPYVESVPSEDDAFTPKHEARTVAPTRTRYVLQQANVRKKPRLEASIIAEVEEGTQIGVVDYVEGWALVHLPETALLTDEAKEHNVSVGFISGELLGHEPPDKLLNSPPLAEREIDPHPTDSLAATLLTGSTYDKAPTIVYITRTGKKYHLETCSHLRNSKIAISLDEALANGYEACKRCRPPSGN